MDDGSIISPTASLMYHIQVPLNVAIDSKDSFTILSTLRNSIEKSIRTNVNVIRYGFERRFVSRIIWIPGREDLVDSGTKTDRPLTGALKLLMQTDHIPLLFPTSETCREDKPLG